MDKEIWKDITGYKGIYQVSSLGRVRSLDRHVIRRGVPSLQHGIIMQPANTNGDYLQAALSKDGKRRYYSVHRLVAQAFIPNPNDLPQVNHIDENKQNNCASNLLWVSASENCKYGNRNATMVQQRSVCVVATDGCMEYQFNSIQEAARELHISAGHISQCCNGKRKTAGGYFWFHK